MLTAGQIGQFTPALRGIINGRYEFEEDPYRPPLTVRRQIVDALIARMEPAGTEELRGVATWRYRLTLNEEQAMDALPNDIVAELAWGQYDRPVYEGVDVWLDAEGRARRVVRPRRVLRPPRSRRLRVVGSRRRSSRPGPVRPPRAVRTQVPHHAC